MPQDRLLQYRQHIAIQAINDNGQQRGSRSRSANAISIKSATRLCRLSCGSRQPVRLLLPVGIALLSRWLSNTSAAADHLHDRQRRGPDRSRNLRPDRSPAQWWWPAARRRESTVAKLAKQSIKISAATGAIWRRSHGHSTKRKNDQPRMPSWAAI